MCGQSSYFFRFSFALIGILCFSPSTKPSILFIRHSVRPFNTEPPRVVTPTHSSPPIVVKSIRLTRSPSAPSVDSSIYSLLRGDRKPDLRWPYTSSNAPSRNLRHVSRSRSVTRLNTHSPFMDSFPSRVAEGSNLLCTLTADRFHSALSSPESSNNLCISISLCRQDAMDGEVGIMHKREERISGCVIVCPVRCPHTKSNAAV